MKKVLALMIMAAGIVFAASSASALESDVDMLLDLLVKKGVVTTEEAVDFRAAVAMKKQDAIYAAKEKPATVPEWVQNIKMGGDVRFRTQCDWGKTTGGEAIQKQRVRERVRGRFYLEAKVCDYVYAGTRIIGGGTNPRSGDDTLDGYWSKDFVMFDQYYIRFEPSKKEAMKYGKYYSDLKLWVGRFAIPFEYNEMTWDPDITPGGIAFQYVSSDIKTEFLPSLKLYTNLAMLWLDESAAINTDPLLFGYQAGVKTDSFGDLGTKVGMAVTFYNFANLQNKTPANSAMTNSRVWRGDLGNVAQTGANSSLFGTLKYEYNLLDVLMTVDNERIFDYDFPHGLYGDFVWNASCHQTDTNKAVCTGAYIGKSKPKDRGDWKARCEWRYIQRDAIPDFLPDSNFYGFGTYTNINTPPGVNGIPAAGGTNGKGIKAAFDYMLFKNTVLSFTYYWMKPIKSDDKRDPWNEFLFDINVKF